MKAACSASPSSRSRRRAIRCLAHRAVRVATPYSQPPSRSGSRIDRARCDLGFNPKAYWDEAYAMNVDTYGGGSMTMAAPSAPAKSSLRFIRCRSSTAVYQKSR